MVVKSKMEMGDGLVLTILDTDIDEFWKICNKLKSTGVVDAATMNQSTKETYALMVENGVIPCIVRGENTQSIFKEYAVETDHITVMLNDVESLLTLFKENGGQVETVI